jgi:hypothetical protein
MLFSMITFRFHRLSGELTRTIEVQCVLGTARQARASTFLQDGCPPRGELINCDAKVHLDLILDRMPSVVVMSVVIRAHMMPKPSAERTQREPKGNYTTFVEFQEVPLHFRDACMQCTFEDVQFGSGTALWTINAETARFRFALRVVCRMGAYPQDSAFSALLSGNGSG